jgi:hypothetical protein
VKDYHVAKYFQRCSVVCPSQPEKYSQNGVTPVVAVAAATSEGAGPRVLLDIGGGHDSYSACLAERYPTLTATVLDLRVATKPGSA